MATTEDTQTINWMQLAGGAHSKSFGHLLNARKTANQFNQQYVHLGSSVEGDEYWQIVACIPSETPSFLETPMLTMLQSLKVEAGFVSTALVDVKQEHLGVQWLLSSGGKTYSEGVALDRALLKALVFAKIGEVLTQQGRNWSVDANKPIVIDTQINGGKECIEEAFAEQGIQAVVRQEHIGAKTQVVIDAPSSLKKLKRCLDVCSTLLESGIQR